MLNTSGSIIRNITTSLREKCLDASLLLVAVIMIPVAVQSAEWENNAGMTISTIATDNVDLSETDEESDLIPIISPFWNVRGQGGGAFLEIIGSFDVKDLGGEQHENNLNLLANANAELIERIFFFDAKMSSSQNAINPLSTSGTNSLSKSDNQTTTQTVSLSPYITGRIKNYANFDARFTYDYVTSEEIDDGDTRSRDFNVSLSSGTSFGAVRWGVNATDRTTDSQSGSSTDKSTLDINLGYQLNRQWQVTGLIGREWTDFTSSGDKEGINWELGGIWTPSPRTSVDFGYGRRYSGPTGHLNLSHRSKRSLITATYSQEITDVNEQLSRVFDDAGFEDARGSYIDDNFAGNEALYNLFILNSFFTTGSLPPGVPNRFDYSSLITDNAQFLNDRFSMSYILTGKRTKLIVTGDYSKQTAGNESETDRFGLSTTISRDISGQLSADAGLSWDRLETDDDSQSDRWDLNLGLNQKLSKQTTLSLRYRHAKRESDNAGESYDEDRVTLSLKHELH